MTRTENARNGRGGSVLRAPARGACALLVAIVAVAAIAPRTAAAEPTLDVELMVSLASDEPGAIDARARKIDARLRREIRYQSLRVLEARTERVGLDQVATIALPNGKRARVRPMAIDERGALLAVDIEGAVKVDARARSGHLLVFSAGRFEGGRLVVSIEPRFGGAGKGR
ncbi:MAG: hypothetical protein R3E88_03505 [Myxococcota bacterium]